MLTILFFNGRRGRDKVVDLTSFKEKGVRRGLRKCSLEKRWPGLRKKNDYFSRVQIIIDLKCQLI